jgi:prepilin-type N-terminal cleavage/methylation domain-containing protein
MKNKGFSLIELIVVIAIMAVIVGIVVPQYNGYNKRARESVAMDEIHSIVKHANITLIENDNEKVYEFAFSTEPTEATSDFIFDLKDDLELRGRIDSMVVSYNNVTYAEYLSDNGIIVAYDVTKSPTIYVIGEGEMGISGLNSYYSIAKGILDGRIQDNAYDEGEQIYNITHDIQEAYALANGGDHPRYVESPAGEKVEELMQEAGLIFHSGTDPARLKWIPSSNNRGDDIIMYAGRIIDDEISGNIIKASIAYYDGRYFYHTHSDTYESQISNVYVGDRGSDTETFEKLISLPEGTKIDGWKVF